ncbi:hypothetical protein JY28_01570 [Neisseria meningitidis]|nr:hypothetical protein JY28_01570 [Neisseria meningitidis]
MFFESVIVYQKEMRQPSAVLIAGNADRSNRYARTPDKVLKTCLAKQVNGFANFELPETRNTEI